MAKVKTTAGFVAALGLLWATAGAAEAQTQFQPQLTHRPRLAFDGRDAGHASRIAARIQNREEPWASMYAAIRNAAETGQTVDHRNSGWASQGDPWAKLYEQEERNGRVAAAKALAGWLWSKGVDPSWKPLPRLAGQSSPEGWVRAKATEAAQTIERMYCSWPCYKGFDVIDRGIVAAASMAAHCEAYDLLGALPANVRPALGTSEQRLGDLANDLNFYYFTVDGQANNHGIRVAAGMGTAGLTINTFDRYRWWNPGTAWARPGHWVANAVGELHPTAGGSVLRHQLERGAYAEGSSYYAYAADLYLPFFFGYNRMLSGGGTPLLRSDLATNGARWGMDLRLPDGRRPAVDNSPISSDATLGFFLSQVPGASRSAADQAALLWDFEKAGRPGLTGAHAGKLLAAYDPPAAAASQSQAMTSPWADPTRILPEAGEAALRSGAGALDGYCLVVAEKGDVRVRGAGHESVDNGHFVFATRGDLVTLSPGYAGFTQVEKTNKGEHHSIVLVDGKAPKPAHKPLGFLPWVSGGEDASIVAGARTQAGAGAAARSVEVVTAYEGATISRTFVLVEDRYLLVQDRCAAGSDKTFAPAMHLNAGAAKARPITLAGTTARFATNRGNLKAAFGAAASAPLTLAKTSEFDANGEGPAGHEALRYSARGRSVTFLAALAANAAAAASPSVESVAVGGAQVLRIEAGGSVDVAISNPGRVMLNVPAVLGGRAIRTDAEIAVVSFGAGGASRVVYRVGGTQVTVQ